MNTSYNPELINAACSGNTEAIEQMLLQYQPTITKFARKYCATPEDIEDAVQETLWIASQKIGTLRVASAFISWLFRIVRNECHRLLHYKRNEEARDNLEVGDFADYNPEHDVLLKRDVIRALMGLSPIYREVVILRDMQGLTTPEVAFELGLTIETVKSRLHRARNALREALQQWRE